MITHQRYRKPLLISVDIDIFDQETKQKKMRKNDQAGTQATYRQLKNEHKMDND